MHPRDGYIVCPNCPFVCTPHKEHSRCPWCAFQTLSRCICGAAIKVPLDAHCSECGKLLRKKPDISDSGEPSSETPQIKTPSSAATPAEAQFNSKEPPHAQ